MNLFCAGVAGLVLAVMMAPGVKADIKVVTSIKPVHSLVAEVMAGTGTPTLIVEGAGSPHTYSMKPSHAHRLQAADVIFWVGHDLEPFLEKPLETLASNATVIELLDAVGLAVLAVREGGAFEAHDDHAKDDQTKHAHSHDAHAHDAIDPHIWLDPENARVMVQAIVAALVAADPVNAARYRTNAEALSAWIEAFSVALAASLEPVKDRPFVVFHDGYQYFEKRFGLNAVGAITVTPDVMPGAERVAEIRDRMGNLGAVCVFAEPQFPPKLIATVAEGMEVRTGVLDPLGAGLEPGAELYFELMRGMATSMRDCLSPQG